MIKNIFGFLLKLVVVASVVSAVLGVIYYFTDKKNDYIEIYNDGEDDYDDYDDFIEEESIIL